ncbi:MAG: hypothetical protein Kow0063_43360 [Anaerolineae bacterium]
MNEEAEPQTTGWATLLDRLWHILASPRLSIFLLAGVAGILILSMIIPQAPPHMEEPLVRSQWLAGVPSRIAPLAERLYSAGIFDLLDSIWLRLPLALLLAHTLVALAHWGPEIWRRLRQPGSAVNISGQPLFIEKDWPGPVEDVRQQLSSRLQKAGYRILYAPAREATQPEQAAFTIQRWRWNWLSLGSMYLGLGLASAGLLLAGWLSQVQELYLTPGEPVAVPASAPGAPSIVLDEPVVTGGDPLRPSGGAAVMRLLAGVGEARQMVLKLHGSQLQGGRWLTLVELRPIANISATNATTGEAVLLQPFSPRIPAREQVRLPLVGDPETRFAGVPSQNVTLHLACQERTGDQPGLRDALSRDRAGAGGQTPQPACSISFFRGAEAEPSQTEPLRDNNQVTFDGVIYQVTFDYAATLRINSSLWWLLVASGWGITALSLTALAVAPPVYGRVDVEARRHGSQVSLTMDVLGDRQRRRQELERLVSSTSEA